MGPVKPCLTITTTKPPIASRAHSGAGLLPARHCLAGPWPPALADRPGDNTMKRTGAQIVWECLVREGVDTVFGYPGGAILPTYDAMLDYPIHHVLVRHEQGATHMADGYARGSGKVGVAIGTSGPGAAHMING